MAAAQQEQKRNSVGDALTEFTAVFAATVNAGVSVAASPVKNWKMVGLAVVSIAAGVSTGGIGFAIGGTVAALASGKAVIDTAVNATNAAKEAYTAVNKTFRPNMNNGRVELPNQNNAAPKNTPEQPAPVRKQEKPIAENKEEKIQIVMPNRQPEAQSTKQKRTTEVASSEPATPEQVSNAQAVVLENPLDITLGAAQQGADGKIVRPVLDVNALLEQTKNNAKGIDEKFDRAMGKSHTDTDAINAINKFTNVLNPNMQKRGISDDNKNATDANKIRFVQAVQASALQAGAYTLTTTVTQGEHPNRTFAIESPLPAGKIGRNVGNAANYALDSVEPNRINQASLMNKAAALSAIEKHSDFKTNGEFDAKKVADAFEKGEFNSFINNTDPQIQALAEAAKMVTNEYHYNKVQAKERETAEQQRETATSELVLTAELINEDRGQQPMIEPAQTAKAALLPSAEAMINDAKTRINQDSNATTEQRLAADFLANTKAQEVVDYAQRLGRGTEGQSYSFERESAVYETYAQRYLTLKAMGGDGAKIADSFATEMQKDVRTKDMFNGAVQQTTTAMMSQRQYA
jgi:hypothetical protein